MNNERKSHLALWPFRVRPFPLERLPLNPLGDFPYAFSLFYIYIKFSLVAILNYFSISNEYFNAVRYKMKKADHCDLLFFTFISVD
ncbi:hypothetical protein JL04_11510 [Gallibacterium anatis]|uniref:Uncharacterized protein n=2 Tax=Gallibacterium anatis TaxID=750 RepID=U1GZ37_9PAST|nr:hypothetical protein N561_11420 [Gallibacterium anatis 12656/12]KGQ25588.1 hypothetical protein JP31_06995 [Gallibacterium anatis]KGQ26487.1 hypothetical protein JP27_06980 [Gallibacterium anatis]KGQ47085.1 hypothetical protein JL04_11510 [Gallibacterium anatis]